MNNNYLFFDPSLAKKCGLKTSIILSQIKLIVQLNKKMSESKNGISIDFISLSKILSFMKDVALKGALKKCYTFLQHKDILKYLDCDSKEFKKILDKLSPKSKRN